MHRPGVSLSARLLAAVALAACSTGEPEATSPITDGDATAPDDAGNMNADGSQSLDSAPIGTADGETLDGGPFDGDAGPSNACEWGGAPGTCITVSACAALSKHSSYAGECPGPASIECCITTPNVADDPPTPAGYVLMQQADVTTDMTTWAVAILNDPATYPMFSTATKTFGTQLVLARVEWHPPDFQNSVVHRGVTLYEPAD